MCKQSSPKNIEPPSKHEKERIEMRIRDRVYDISEFVHKHPGGRIIAYYGGQDGTDAFDAFHARCPKAEAWLKALPSRKAEPTQMVPNEKSKIVLEDYRKLRQQFEAEGLFKPSLPHVIFRGIEVISLFAVSFILLKQGTVFSVLASMIVGGLAGGRAGWLQHEGGHNSLTGVVKIDKNIQRVAISFGLVTYGWKWNHMHNKHHASPQKENHDLDVDTLPFVAFYKQALDRGRRASITPNWWIRYQHYTFIPVATVLNVFFWHFYLHPKEYLFRKKRRDPVTLACVLLRYIMHWHSCPSQWSHVACLASFWVTMCISGMYLFGNFSLNHTHLPTLMASENRNWVEYAIDYTMDVDPNILSNWWMGYLNCQIEHHLFPSMPQFRQPAIVPRVRKFCQDHGLYYQSMPYFKAVNVTIGNLRDVAKYAEQRAAAAGEAEKMA